MKRIANAPSGNLYPYCPGRQDFEDVLQEVIAGMAHVDTSQEDLCVRNFQSRVIVPDPRTNADKAQLVLRWCVNNGLGEQFREALKTYGALAPRREGGDWLESVDLTIGGIAPEKLPFFIAVLPHCPQIKGIDLPIPATSEQAAALADALARNSGLNRLELHASETAPLDSTALFQLFSHPAKRAGTLKEFRIHVKDEPAGDTDWVQALCEAIATRLQTESAQLTLPWTSTRLTALFDAIAGACPLKSLSFPGCSFDEDMVDAVITTLGHNQSLTQLDLGDTPRTAGQRDKIDTVLWNNRNTVAWEYLSGTGRV
ncbi:hypothetical protein [Rhizobacter sp. P5_C2]